EFVFDPSGTHFSFIGGGQVTQFEQAVLPPVNQTYTYTADFTGQVPAGATSLVVSADWSKPAAGATLVGRPKFVVKKVKDHQTTMIPEDQFAANGISFVSDARFNGPTKAA